MKFNDILDNLKNYEAGKPIELVVREYGIKPKDIIKLASNENPYGVSKVVQELIKQKASDVYMYPDDSMYELKEKLANRFELESSNFIIGAGSDQVIDFIIKAKTNPSSNILIAGVTFAMYEIYARQTGANVIKTDDIFHNLDQFRDIYKKNKIDLIFLCLPNNPLGECLDRDEVFSFLDEIEKDTLVVIDGAYQEYAKYKDKNKEIKPKDLLKYPNTIYLGTFSKAFGLGGLRVGYGISNKEIINNLSKLRPPFNITTLSLASAIKALDDMEFIKNSIKNNFIQMKRYEDFAKDNNLDFIESYTNFITIYIKNSTDVAQKLLKKGIIVRDMASYGFGAIRVTIGTKEQNTRVFEVLNEIIKD